MRPLKRQSPPGRAGLAKQQTKGRGLHSDSITATDPVQRLLDRLEGVRKVGGGWIAHCPAHEDRRPSLSIGGGDDGRALLSCHGGCPAAAVVAAVGLELADLFPRRLDIGPMTSEQRRKVSAETRTRRTLAALNAALPMIALVEVTAAAIADGEPLDEQDTELVRGAHQRLQELRLAVQGGMA
ncbi:MAG: hypothetical protein WCZ02_07875 [Lysobacterales bacterium]